MRDGQEGRRTPIERLNHVVTEMLFETGLPLNAHAIAGLENRAETRACPAPDQSQVASVRSRHDLQNGARLPMAATAKHDALVGPSHELILRHFKTHGAVALGILAPAFPDLHEQKEMHPRFGHVGALRARRSADRFDHSSILSQNDLALALTLHIDRLRYAN